MQPENLWAPWRMAYLRGLDQQRDVLLAADPAAARDTSDRNFLAAYWRSPDLDDAHLVILRDASGLILLNRYPYANGHLLVALGDARPTLLDYDPPQRDAFWRLVETAFALMRHALAPQGINFGINEGTAAGAGVPEHLHAHLVPRWNADTNFMSVIPGVRVIPASLEAVAASYRESLRTMPAPRVG